MVETTIMSAHLLRNLLQCIFHGCIILLAGCNSVREVCVEQGVGGCGGDGHERDGR